MEAKWLAIMAIGVFGTMFLAIGVEKYNSQQCRIAAIQAKLPADEIAKVCK